MTFNDAAGLRMTFTDAAKLRMTFFLMLRYSEIECEIPGSSQANLRNPLFLN